MPRLALSNPTYANDHHTSIAELRQVVADFVAERDWNQFHLPKNVAMSIAIEAAELMEHFQWVEAGDSRGVANDDQKLAAVGEELADVLGYCFSLANELGIDISSTLRAKMKKNEAKYPIDRVHGARQDKHGS